MYDYYDDYDYGDIYFYDGSTVIIWLYWSLIFLLAAARYVSISTLFIKAGEAPWKSLIPFYNTYTFFKLTWNKMMFIPYACGIAGLMIGFIGFCYTSYTRYYYTGAQWNVFFMLLMVAGGILSIVFQIMLDYRIAKAYGKDVGYTVGLVFLGTIFLMILGFGSARYMGNSWLQRKSAIQSYPTGSGAYTWNSAQPAAQPQPTAAQPQSQPAPQPQPTAAQIQVPGPQPQSQPAQAPQPQPQSPDLLSSVPAATQTPDAQAQPVAPTQSEVDDQSGSDA